LLLDTQVLVWHAVGSKGLSRRAADVIHRGGNHYSHATLWELAIKSALQKVHLILDGERRTARDFMLAIAARLQLAPLPIEFDDISAVELLPWYHRDPFDRLLAVQARRRGMPIVSSDPVFEDYGVKRIW